MRIGGRPTKSREVELDAESEQVAVAYFGNDVTTLDIAKQFGLSRRAVYRRVDRALKNRKKTA